MKLSVSCSSRLLLILEADIWMWRNRSEKPAYEWTLTRIFFVKNCWCIVIFNNCRVILKGTTNLQTICLLRLFDLLRWIHWVPLTVSSVITSTRLQRVDFSHVQIFLSLTPMLNKFSYNEYRLQWAEFSECNCSL